MHAYWAPNAWALYLFVDRVLLAVLKVVGLADASAGTGSTTGAVQTGRLMPPHVSRMLSMLVSCCGNRRETRKPK